MLRFTEEATKAQRGEVISPGVPERKPEPRWLSEGRDPVC